MRLSFRIFLVGGGGTSGKPIFARKLRDPNEHIDERYLPDGNHIVDARFESNHGDIILVNLLVVSGQTTTEFLPDTLLELHGGMREGGIMIYDRSSKTTLAKLVPHIKAVLDGVDADMPLVMVGNNADKPRDESLGDFFRRESMIRLRKDYHWFETSAKDNPLGLKEPLQELLRLILRRRNDPRADDFELLTATMPSNNGGPPPVPPVASTSTPVCTKMTPEEMENLAECISRKVLQGLQEDNA